MNKLQRWVIRVRCAFGRHTWEGCACRFCGKENHDWEWILLDPYAPMTNLFDEVAASRKRCRRCKMWDGGRPPAIDPDELPSPF